MIQRRQTLFLIQLVFFGIALLFVPSIKVLVPSGPVSVFFVPPAGDTFSSSPGHLAAIAINFAALLISSVAIFLYKRRELQAKLCYALMLLWLTITLMVEFCPFVKLSEGVSSIENTHFGTLIGIFGMLAAYLALRYIRRDIELLKSADRIR